MTAALFEDNAAVVRYITINWDKNTYLCVHI